MSVGKVNAGSGASRVDANRVIKNADGTSGVYKPVNVEEGQGLNRNVSSAASANATEAVTPVKAPAPTDKKETPAPPDRISRQMTNADVAEHLIKLQKPVTAENKQTVLAMLQHGLAVSEDNFSLMARLKNGSSGQANDISTAALVTSKGLSDIPRTVDMLSTFLNQSNPLSSQMLNMREAIQSLVSGLKMQDGLISKGLSIGLASVLADLDRQLKKLSQLATETGLELSKLSRGNLIKDLTTLSGFLSGLEEKLLNGQSNAKGVQQPLEELQSYISKFVETLVSQAVLSKESQSFQATPTEKFAYWQIPNPLAKGKDIDILIRKDPAKKGVLDPAKTRMVLRLDTPDIGELAINMDIMDQKIWYLFHTDRLSTQRYIAELEKNLKERMEAINYKTMAVRTVKKKLDIKKLLMPIFNLDSISRINAEI